MDRKTWDEGISSPKSVNLNKRGLPTLIFVETTTSDLIPMNVVRLRRDKHINKGVMRKKYINLKSNVCSTHILINESEVNHRITRGHGVIKIDISNFLIGLESGYHIFKLKYFYKSSEISEVDKYVEKDVKIDYRARCHHRANVGSLSAD